MMQTLFCMTFLVALFSGLYAIMRIEDLYLPEHMKEGYMPPAPQLPVTERAPTANVVELASVKEQARNQSALSLAA